MSMVCSEATWLEHMVNYKEGLELPSDQVNQSPQTDEKSRFSYFT